MSIHFEYLPCPKSVTSHRIKPKRGVSGKFSPNTIKAILERDNGQCVRCGTYQDLESVPHHIIYKSQMGKGTIDNGVTVCRPCHRLAHEKKDVRKWFEQYREERLV